MMMGRYIQQEAGLPMNISHTNAISRPLMTVGLIACLGLGTVAFAQTRAGNDGRALDANQQVGSAGYNPADGRLDFSQGNNIVTGNVGGGRGFKDDIGYGAVGEFTDTEGYGLSGRSDDFNDSNTLYDFRAGSLSSSPSYFNAASVGGVGPNRNLSVYRSYTNRVAQPQAPGLIIAPRGGGYQLSSNTGSLNTIRGNRITTYQVGNLPPGLALQAFSSSQTLGLRGNAVTSEALSRRLYERAEESHSLDAPKGMVQPTVYGTDLFDPYGKRKEAKASPQELQPGQIPPTLMIGQQLQDLTDAGVDPSQAFGSAQVLDSVFQPLSSADAQADVDDTYLNLLRAIHENKEDSGTNDAWEGTLEAPTAQQLTEAERDYDQIMKDMYGDDYKTRRTQSDSTPDPDDESGEDVQNVVDQLNYNLPRLETLAANKQTRIARLTREAEAALANGKYLSAESRYRQIIVDVKNDPLPRMGLVHAQLGAGMFRSAGMNLRAVFIQHPELIAARYDAKLLPPESRLQWVQQELQAAISQGEGGKDAPLLMAYLGYQASSHQVIRYGMALAQSKSPRDPLLAVLREIWLDESDGK
jgi:hypothetical protein